MICVRKLRCSYPPSHHAWDGTKWCPLSSLPFGGTTLHQLGYIFCEWSPDLLSLYLPKRICLNIYIYILFSTIYSSILYSLYKLRIILYIYIHILTNHVYVCIYICIYIYNYIPFYQYVWKWHLDDVCVLKVAWNCEQWFLGAERASDSARVDDKIQTGLVYPSKMVV